jgi:putative cell wall-binding protein
MRSRSFGWPFLLAIAVVAALFATTAPAFARPVHAARMKPSLVALAADDDIPGVALGPSPVSGTLDQYGDTDDVYRIHLDPGDTLLVSLTGPSGTHFFADIYGPKATSVFGDVEQLALSDGLDYPQVVGYTAGTAGNYYIDLYSALGGSGSYTLAWSVTPAPIDMDRYEGGDRYATAIRVSNAAYGAGGSRNVILATGAGYADALAASALAGSYDCPILLTRPRSLPDGLLAEIDRLRGSASATVTIVGSGSAVDTSVATALAAHGLAVDRLAGPDRFGTAVEIGKRVKEHEDGLGHAWQGAAFVVNGMNYPDALASAPYAARMKMPILLVQPTSAPQVTQDAFAQLALSKAYVVGGTSAVQDPVMLGLAVATKERVHGGVYGDTRYTTATQLAEVAIAKSWASSSTVGIATGRNFPDALGGGALIAKMNGVLLLTEPAYLPGATGDFVHLHRSTLVTMRTFGSSSAVSDDIFGEFIDALQN